MGGTAFVKPFLVALFMLVSCSRGRVPLSSVSASLAGQSMRRGRAGVVDVFGRRSTAHLIGVGVVRAARAQPYVTTPYSCKKCMLYGNKCIPGAAASSARPFHHKAQLSFLSSKPIARYIPFTDKNFNDFAPIYLQISELLLLAASSSFLVGVSTP